jgi:hypothetical protein
MIAGASGLAVAADAAAAPASAGKSKKGSFTADNMVPFPHPDGCNIGSGSMEGVNYVAEPFKAPSDGVLTVTMSGFDGDWDLFVNDSSGSLILASSESQLQGAPATEEVAFALTKGSKVLMTPCNWVGGPSATVDWKFSS